MAKTTEVTSVFVDDKLTVTGHKNYDSVAECHSATRLIAAAPKLLEACKAAVSSFGIRDAFLLPDELNALRLVKQAIAEAEEGK